jgi:hypothetical protein
VRYWLSFAVFFTVVTALAAIVGGAILGFPLVAVVGIAAVAYLLAVASDLLPPGRPLARELHDEQAWGHDGMHRRILEQDMTVYRAPESAALRADTPEPPEAGEPDMPVAEADGASPAARRTPPPILTLLAAAGLVVVVLLMAGFAGGRTGGAAAGRGPERSSVLGFAAPTATPTTSPVTPVTASPTERPVASPASTASTTPATATAAPTLSPTPPPAATAAAVSNISGRYRLIDTISSGPYAGQQYAFNVTLTQLGSAVSGNGGGLKLTGNRIGNHLHLEFSRGKGTGRFDWEIQADGNLAGTFTDDAAGNSGASSATRGR